MYREELLETTDFTDHVFTIWEKSSVREDATCM